MAPRRPRDGGSSSRGAVAEALDLLAELRGLGVPQLDAGHAERAESAAASLEQAPEGSAAARELLARLLAAAGPLIDQLLEQRPSASSEEDGPALQVEEPAGERAAGSVPDSALAVVSALLRSIRHLSGPEPAPKGAMATAPLQLVERALTGRLISLAGWLCDAIKARGGRSCSPLVNLADAAIYLLLFVAAVDKEAEDAALLPAARLGAACARLPPGSVYFGGRGGAAATAAAAKPAGAAAPREFVVHPCHVVHRAAVIIARGMCKRQNEFDADDDLGALAAMEADDALVVLLAAFCLVVGHLHVRVQPGAGGDRAGGGSSGCGEVGAVPAAHEDLLAALGMRDVAGMLAADVFGYIDSMGLGRAVFGARQDLEVAVLLLKVYALRGPLVDSLTPSFSAFWNGMISIQYVPEHLRLPLACTMLQLAACCAAVGEGDSARCGEVCLRLVSDMLVSMGDSLAAELLPQLLEWGAAAVLGACVSSSRFTAERDELCLCAASILQLCCSQSPKDRRTSLLRAAPTPAVAALEAVARVAADTGPRRATAAFISRPIGTPQASLGCSALVLEFTAQSQQQHMAVQLSACVSAAKIQRKWDHAGSVPLALESAIRLGRNCLQLAQEAVSHAGDAGGGGGGGASSSSGGGNGQQLSSHSAALAACAMVVVGRSLRLAARALQRAAAGAGAGGEGGGPDRWPGRALLKEERAIAERSGSVTSQLGGFLAPLASSLPLTMREGGCAGAVGGGPLQELLQHAGALRASVQMAEQQLAEPAAGGVAPSATSSAAAEAVRALLQQPAAAGLAEQMDALGGALCTQHPSDLCCNNPDCTTLGAALSEAQLVVGKAHRCSSCRTARYCSRACQVAQWREHKPVCRRLAAGAKGAGGSAGGAAGGGGGGSRGSAR